MNQNSNRAFAPYLQAVKTMSQKTANSGKGQPNSHGNVTGRAFGGGYHQS